MKLNENTQACNHVTEALPAPQTKPQHQDSVKSTVDDDASSAAASETSRSSHSSKTDVNDVPSEFICPLTLEIMNDPVMDKQGINFERSAIAKWLHRGNTTHPLTREPLSLSKLVSNAHLRKQIIKWKELHGMPVINVSNHMRLSMDGSNNVDQEDYPDLDPHFFVGTIEAPLESTMGEFWSERMALARALELQSQVAAAAQNTRPHESGRRRRRQQSRRGSTSGNRTERTATTSISPAARSRRALGRVLASIRGNTQSPPLGR